MTGAGLTICWGTRRRSPLTAHRFTMLLLPLARHTHAGAAFAMFLAAGCAGGSDGASADGAGGAGSRAMPHAAPMPTNAMQMGSMMMDSAMAMLHGFCVTAPPASPGAPAASPHVELIVAGDAARRPTRIAVTSTPPTAGADALSAELSAGEDARAECSGPGRTIFIGGTAMYLGNPTLRLTSATPVTVLARTVQAQTLAGPVRVAPGKQGVVLAWGAGQP